MQSQAKVTRADRYLPRTLFGNLRLPGTQGIRGKEGSSGVSPAYTIHLLDGGCILIRLSNHHKRTASGDGDDGFP